MSTVLRENHCKGCLWWIVSLLIARCIALPFLPLADPTEGRYAVIAKEMVNSGDWVTPYLWMDGQRVPFLGKPPLYFWCSAACMKVFGINEFSARLPGVISFAITLLIIGSILCKYKTPTIAWRAVFLCLSCVVLLVSSGIVIVDMLVTMCVTGAIFGYYAFCRESDAAIRKRWSLLVFGMLGLGFMTKGPVAVALFVLPVLIWTVWFRRWKEVLGQEWYWGITLFAIIVFPWFILAEERNPGFIRYFFVNENFLRFIVHNYGDKYGSGHDYMRGSAIWMMLLAAAPWSFYAMYQLLRQRKPLPLKEIIRSEELAFFLCIVIVNTLFWSMARQLLITYLFAMVPAFMAWLSILMSRYPALTPSKDPLFKKTAIVIGFVTIIGILVFPCLLERSTKDVIEKANELSEGRKFTMYFVKHVPYSAYFYGDSIVVAHPDETVEASISHGDKEEHWVYAAENKYYKQLSQDMHQNILVMAYNKRFTLFRLTMEP
jgi:4-amino-4-deoxy-L-arabinose transferase-like glycosyltransferase